MYVYSRLDFKKCENKNVVNTICVFRQKKHEQLLLEQKDLIASRDDRRKLAEDFRRRSQKLTKSTEVDKCRYAEQLEREKVSKWFLLKYCFFTRMLELQRAAVVECNWVHLLNKKAMMTPEVFLSCRRSWTRSRRMRPTWSSRSWTWRQPWLRKTPRSTTWKSRLTYVHLTLLTAICAHSWLFHRTCTSFWFKVFAAVPERNVVFKGATGGPGDTPMFDMEPRIVYPMIGGTALITFEEEVGELISEPVPQLLQAGVSLHITFLCFSFMCCCHNTKFLWSG